MEKNTFFHDWQNLIDDFERFSKSEDNPYFKSKYVPLKQILPVVKEKCKKHNFIWMQYPGMVDGKPVLHTKIRHESGEEIEGTAELVHKPEDPQKLGASITYMRRYSLTCMLGLEEEDDDGNTASGKQNQARPNCSNCGKPMGKSQKGTWVCQDWKTEKDQGLPWGTPQWPQEKTDYYKKMENNLNLP